MAAGDHIRVLRGFYWHHGIDSGDGTVIHYTGTPFERNAAVKRESRNVFAEGGEVEVVSHPGGFGAHKTIGRARSRMGEKKYDLVFNNCEHFALWCCPGEHRSEQVDVVTGMVGVVVPRLVMAAELRRVHDSPENHAKSGARDTTVEAVLIGAKMTASAVVDPLSSPMVSSVKHLKTGKEITEAVRAKLPRVAAGLDAVDAANTRVEDAARKATERMLPRKKK